MVVSPADSDSDHGNQRDRAFLADRRPGAAPRLTTHLSVCGTGRTICDDGRALHVPGRARTSPTGESSRFHVHAGSVRSSRCRRADSRAHRRGSSERRSACRPARPCKRAGRDCRPFGDGPHSGFSADGVCGACGDGCARGGRAARPLDPAWTRGAARGGGDTGGHGCGAWHHDGSAGDRRDVSRGLLTAPPATVFSASTVARV